MCHVRACVCLHACVRACACVCVCITPSVAFKWKREGATDGPFFSLMSGGRSCHWRESVIYKYFFLNQKITVMLKNLHFSQTWSAKLKRLRGRVKCVQAVGNKSKSCSAEAIKSSTLSWLLLCFASALPALNRLCSSSKHLLSCISSAVPSITSADPPLVCQPSSSLSGEWHRSLIGDSCLVWILLPD